MDRLQAKRGGHRTVATKNINEARTILEHTDLEDIMWSRFKVVEKILDEKLILLAEFDEEITKICSVDHIEEETEVADEIRSRILQTKGEIAIARARVKKWRDVFVYFFFTWFGKNSSYRGTYSHQKPKSSSCAITT